MPILYKTFISVGNSKQHFLRLLDAVSTNIELLPTPILIQRGHTPFVNQKCEVKDFIDMDSFVTVVANAEVLILQAGAGCVFHSIKMGKIPILMPREKRFNEHVNDHQIAFARSLHEEHKVIMIQNSIELPAAIASVRTSRKETHSYIKSNSYTILEETLNTILK